MVVMDQLSDDFETLDDHTSPLSTSIFNDMSTKLDQFHAGGYVHGDICAVNIMVSKSDKKQFMIIGFDWAGEQGTAWYPAYVNHDGITRPAGGQFGEEILTDHDSFMLKHITETMSRQ